MQKKYIAACMVYSEGKHLNFQMRFLLFTRHGQKKLGITLAQNYANRKHLKY